jgi:hypothetical protein
MCASVGHPPWASEDLAGIASLSNVGHNVGTTELPQAAIVDRLTPSRPHHCDRIRFLSHEHSPGPARPAGLE